MKRHKISMRRSRKAFTRGALKVHPVNAKVVTSNRGGVRL